MGHAHHHNHAADQAMGKRFILAIILNLVYVASEFYLGFHYDSVGLLADAGHNLSDIGGLFISLIAIFLLRKHSDKTFTYGYKKATVLAAFANSMMLAAAAGIILYECIEKLFHGTTVSGIAIMVTAGIGILVNGFTVFLLSGGKEHDLNVKSAYLHMIADALVSCGVVISGGMIYLTHWTWLDPVIGFLIAGIILWTSRGVLRESLILTLDGVPSDVDVSKLEPALLRIENVADVHHVHIRAVSTTENELTAHVKLYDISLLETTKESLKHVLSEYRIHHSVLEFECLESGCHGHC